MTERRIDVLAIIDQARRDLQIAAEFKGMSSANESAAALISARDLIEDLIDSAFAAQLHDDASYLGCLCYFKRRREVP